MKLKDTAFTEEIGKQNDIIITLQRSLKLKTVKLMALGRTNIRRYTCSMWCKSGTENNGKPFSCSELTVENYNDTKYKYHYRFQNNNFFMILTQFFNRVDTDPIRFVKSHRNSAHPITLERNVEVIKTEVK